MVDMDDLALMNSEVFRNYAETEISRMKSEAQMAPVLAEAEQEKLLEEFEAFQDSVRSSPKKLAVFRELQKKFASDPEYMAKTNVSFVNAVLMLNLD